VNLIGRKGRLKEGPDTTPAPMTILPAILVGVVAVIVAGLALLAFRETRR
jgi:hypothetical protein